MQGASSNSPGADFAAGSLIRGKYRVQAVLGRGGMGTVLEAVHLDLDRRVAIKVLHPELRDNVEVVERFVREGRAAAKIDGDHVARVFDVDRLDDGTPILVMEFLVGRDLSYVRRDRAPLSIYQATNLVLQACTAIDLAHARGVIHRDLKPANLFITETDDGALKLKVLDFGISKLSSPLGGSEPSVTRTTLVMGSVEFMSPEQMLSTRDVDVRTDIWALGVVLFELLTAVPPFSGDTITQVCAHVMSQPPASPRSLRSDLPEALERVILRCLEKDRANRYANVSELADALRLVCAGAEASQLAGEAPPPAWRASSPGPDVRPGVTSVLPTSSATTVLPGSLGASAPSLHTAAGVASEPLSPPPKRRGPVRVVALAVTAVGVVASATALVRSRFNDMSAASNAVPVVVAQVSLVRASATTSAAVKPMASVFVEPLSSSLTQSSSEAVPTTSAQPKKTPAPRPTQAKPAAPKTTARPSGID